MKDYKVCIIAVAKNEEAFLKEWYEWHINIGFNHIFLADNNDIGDELKLDYPNMTVVPWNGKVITTNRFQQLGVYNYLYENYVKNHYDYFIAIDIDEFVDLKNNYKSVQDFLNSNIGKYSNNHFRLWWETYDDNGYIWETELPSDSVVENYTKLQSNIEVKDDGRYDVTTCLEYKTIMPAEFDKEPYNYSVWESYIKGNDMKRNDISVRHYMFKCFETFIKHKYLQCRFYWNTTKYVDLESALKRYFIINKYTKEKYQECLKVIEKYKSQSKSDSIYDKKLHIFTIGLNNTFEYLNILKESIKNLFPGVKKTYNIISNKKPELTNVNNTDIISQIYYHIPDVPYQIVNLNILAYIKDICLMNNYNDNDYFIFVTADSLFCNKDKCQIKNFWKNFGEIITKTDVNFALSPKNYANIGVNENQWNKSSISYVKNMTSDKYCTDSFMIGKIKGLYKLNDIILNLEKKDLNAKCLPISNLRSYINKIIYDMPNSINFNIDWYSHDSTKLKINLEYNCTDFSGEEKWLSTQCICMQYLNHISINDE